VPASTVTVRSFCAKVMLGLLLILRFVAVEHRVLRDRELTRCRDHGASRGIAR